MISTTKTARFGRAVALLAGVALATTAVAQTASEAGSPSDGLNIPDTAKLFGKFDPNIRKPTAIVNDTVITGTDVDQRIALIVAANQLKISDEERQHLRVQIVNQLIDEALQIQEAKANKIDIGQPELNQSFDAVAKRFNRSPAEMRTYLRQVGSSERSLRRQIEGELAWSRFLRRNVDVNISDEEIDAILKRLEQAKGTEEYHVNEIYMSATPDRAQQVHAAMLQMIEKIQKGEAPFGYFARSFSEASTAAVDGDLGWVRGAQLPEELSHAAATMQVGQIAGPIEVPGGFSILLVVDKRKVLTADPRDSRLALKQLTVSFPKGTTQAQATARVSEFATATKEIHGCGDVEKLAARIGADVVDRDGIVVRDLPPALQDIVLKMQVGESSPPFGSAEDGVRTLVLCGRDEPRSGQLPGKEQLRDQMEQQRVNLRAQTKLRDLRRDAIVEYR